MLINHSGELHAGGLESIHVNLVCEDYHVTF